MQQNQSTELLEELNIRFMKKPRRCRKVNDSLIGFSQRIVCINNNTFYYYPMIQQFKDLDFDKLQYVVPKAGVKLQQILLLKFPQRRTNQRNHFSIALPTNKILKYTKTYKEIIVDEQADGQTVWTFYFDYDIIALPQKQKRIERAVLKEREAQRRKNQQEKKYKEKQERQKNQKLNNQYNMLVQTQNIQQQDSQYNRNRKQLLLREERQNKIKQSDDLNFQYYYHKLVSQDNNLENTFRLQINVLQKIGDFTKRAQQAVRNLIDQLAFNVEGLQYGASFKFQNFIMKIGDKSLNQQFLSNYYTSIALFNLRKKKQLHTEIRVPLYSLIKYKGFKVLVRSITPVDSQKKKQLQDQIVHGNTKDTWKTHFFISQDLNNVCNQMNILSYNAEVHYQKVQIHLGIYLKVIQTQKDPFREVRKIYPETQIYPGDTNYNIYYLIDVDEVFPIDLDLQNNVNQASVRLRPQFVLNYKDRENKKLVKLSGGGLFYGIDNQSGEIQDLQIAKASQYLKYVCVEQLVKNLDQLKFIPYTSAHFSKIMKENGINTRYLNQIYKITSLPYIKQMTIVEAIARCIKKFYRDHQIQFTTKLFRKKYSQLIKQAFDKKKASSLKTIRIKQLKQKQKEQSINDAIDLLNLIFGNSEQSILFWQIIGSEVKKQYNIIIPQATDLSQGYLLITILYHCGFSIKLHNRFNLFIHPTPFTVKDWVDFKQVTSSYYQYPEMQVFKKIKVNENLSKQQLQNKLQLSLLISRSLKRQQQQALVHLSKIVNGIQPPKQKFSINSLYYYLYNPTAHNFQLAHSICQFIVPYSHPLNLQVYLKYAMIQDFDPITLKKSAKYHTIRNLGINHWKTSQILASFKQQDYTQHLIRAELGVQDSHRLQLYLNIVKELDRVGKLIDCTIYVNKSIQWCKKYKLTENQKFMYFQILGIGMKINYNMRRLQDMLKLSEYLWIEISDIEETKWYEFLIQQCVKVFLETNLKKFYLFKVVLVIQSEIQNQILTQSQKTELIKELRKTCKQSKGHINWIKDIIAKVQFGSQELNNLQDFFSNFHEHVHKINSEQFNQGLNDFYSLVKIFGKSYFEQALMNKISIQQNKKLID